MRAREIRERSDEDLLQLEMQLSENLFQHRLKNATNQLPDTSVLKKTQKDLARVKTIIGERKLR